MNKAHMCNFGRNFNCLRILCIHKVFYSGASNVIFRLKNVNQMIGWWIWNKPTEFRIPLLKVSAWVKSQAGQEFSGLKVSRELLGYILIRNFREYMPTISKVSVVSKLDHSAVLCSLEWRWLNENVTISREDDVKQK